MANHKRKSNYRRHRSCGLCKPYKRSGNSRQRWEGSRPDLLARALPKKLLNDDLLTGEAAVRRELLAVG